jgi:hypothetical protein
MAHQIERNKNIPYPKISKRFQLDRRAFIRLIGISLDNSINQNYLSLTSRRHEGRFAIVTERWRGMRWTLRRQAGSLAGRNVCSVRRSRVVLAPRPWRLSFPACAGEATVTRNAAHRGEHEVSRKAIARGKSGCLGCTCLIRVRCFFFAHGAAGAVSARLSLRPFVKRGTTNLNSSGGIESRE